MSCTGVLLTLGIALAGAPDPVITIRTAADNGQQGILGTFNVVNKGNKTLVDITLYVFRKDTGVYYFAAKSIDQGKIPDINVLVAGGQTNYDCLAVLQFQDGKDKIKTCSVRKTNIIVNSGTADKTNYGQLSNAPDVTGNDVAIVTGYAQDPGKKWTPDTGAVVSTWLLPVKGGRYAPVDSDKKDGFVWYKKRTGVANGDYLLIAVLPIAMGTTKNNIASKITAVTVPQGPCCPPPICPPPCPPPCPPE
jgi:hypothetical protein